MIPLWMWVFVTECFPKARPIYANMVEFWSQPVNFTPKSEQCYHRIRYWCE